MYLLQCLADRAFPRRPAGSVRTGSLTGPVYMDRCYEARFVYSVWIRLRARVRKLRGFLFLC